MIKLSYIQFTENHKNSRGELAEWTVRKHESGAILQSFKSKEEAEKALQRMHIFSRKKQQLEIRHVPGTKDSKGDTAEWVVRDNVEREIVKPFKYKYQAEKYLRKLKKMSSLDIAWFK